MFTRQSLSNELFRIATPATSIPRSPIHDVFERVSVQVRAGRRVIPLHIAEPSSGPAESVVEALRSACGRRMDYSDARGLWRLREALVQKLEEHNGIRVHHDQVIIASGATQAMLAVERTLATAGAELLMARVHWPMHLQQCLLAGLQPRIFDLSPDYGLDLQAIVRAATPRTRAILLNTPNNPTGAVYARDQLAEVLALARERDWIVLSDEAYEDFAFDGHHVSIAALECDVPVDERRVFSFFSFSKSHGLGTCRLGYVVAPNQSAAQALSNVQEMSIMVPATLVQHGGIAALDCRDFVTDIALRLRNNRDTLLLPLHRAGMLARLPAGGWYTLVDVSRCGMNDDSFAHGLLEEEGVAVVPAPL